VKSVVLRLATSLVAVIGFWMLVWLPLAETETSAAERVEKALGDPNAPVTIIEYSSLTCPHCAHFHIDTLPALKERYIQTGEVRLVFRDFPLNQRALEAAVLAHCSGPDRYYGFIDVLFKQQASWATAEGLGPLRQIGRLAGLSEEEMDACLADQALADSILQVRLEAQETYEVNSTPSFVIDDEVIAGALGIDEFAEIIDPLVD
jgi:protein-disulfide isomerase